MTGEMVAVVTADIISSKQYPAENRVALDTLLKEAFQTAAAVFPEAVHASISFSIIQGDEFQFVLKNPAKAYSFVVFMRSLLAVSSLDPKPSFRAAIGIGEIAIHGGGDSYAMDGAAFHLSREGMVNVKTVKSCRDRLTILATAQGRPDESVNIILMYQDMLERHWTREQHTAVRWRLENETYGKIGEKVGIAQQNVQKRLKAARWDEFSTGMTFIEKTLQVTVSGVNPLF